MSVVNKIRCQNVLYDIEDTDAQNDIANIYTKAEVDALLEAVKKVDLLVVTELPTEDISTSSIYLLPIDSENPNDGYYEYVYSERKSEWTLIGKTKTDVSSYYTKDQVDELLENKQDALTIDSELSTSSNNPVQNSAITLVINSKVSATQFAEALAKKADKTDIPSKLSDLTNDTDYIADENYVHTDNNFTDELKSKLDDIESGADVNVQPDWNETDSAKDNYIKNKPELADVATSGSYTDLINKPVNLSFFTNDKGFIDKTVNNLTNYYLKSETYSKTEVDSLINGIVTISIIVADSLPTENIKTNTIYMIPADSTSDNDIYDEYLYISSKWERIGSSQIDLSDYYTKSEIDTKLSGKADSFTTLSIDKGGTGGSTAKEATYNLFSGMNTGKTDITDSDYIVTPISSADSTTGPFLKRSVSYLWNWIKSKISSVLGLTKDSYGGNSATADSATKASQDASGNVISDTYATKSEIPTTLPASDVSSWAKASTKPTYSASEVGAAAASHTHYSSDINTMSGYSKPDETSAIETTDSLNQAIGKLEKAIEGKSSGTVTSVQVQATSPVVSSVDTAENETFNTTISLADNYGDTQNPFGSKTAKYFLAAPNTSNGKPTFRAIVASDIPTLNQNTTGSAAKLTTARKLTIGNTGKTFNGSAAVSWSLSEIGAAAASHTHDYLPLAGGTMTGDITFSDTQNWPTFNQDTSGTADYATNLGTSTDSYTKATLDTVLSEKLPYSGGTMTGSIKLPDGAYITEGTSDSSYIMLGCTGKIQYISTPRMQTYLRSSGDNLYHTAGSKNYKILDASNYSGYTWPLTRLNNLLAGVTPINYANSTAYAVGDYVWYNNFLYECITAVDATNTEWPSTSFKQISFVKQDGAKVLSTNDFTDELKTKLDGIDLSQYLGISDEAASASYIHSGRIYIQAVTPDSGSDYRSCRISLEQLITYLLDNGKIVKSSAGYYLINVYFRYSDNNILQFSCNGYNWELQLAGSRIELIGYCNSYNSGQYVLRIHSAPKTNFTNTDGYVKFPVNSIAVYNFCGEDYTPAWSIFLSAAIAYSGTSVRPMSGLAVESELVKKQNLLTAGEGISIEDDVISAETTEQATNSALGTIKLGSDVVQTVVANSPTNQANKTYPVQLDSEGHAVVNVPWINSDSGDTNYTMGTSGNNITLVGTDGSSQTVNLANLPYAGFGYLGYKGTNSCYYKYIILCKSSDNFKISGSLIVTRNNSTKNYGIYVEFSLINAGSARDVTIDYSSQSETARIVTITIDEVEYIAIEVYTAKLYYGAAFYWDVIKSASLDYCGTIYDYTAIPDSVTELTYSKWHYGSSIEANLEGNASSADKVNKKLIFNDNKSFDGSEEVNVELSDLQGTLPIESGGTGGTSVKESRFNLCDSLNNLTSDIADTTLFLFSYISPTSDNGAIYTRTAANVLSWLKTSFTELPNFYTKRPSSADLTPSGNGGLSKFIASSTMTTNKPLFNGSEHDSHIIHLFWDNTNGYDSQIAVTNGTAHLAIRSQNKGTWESWKDVLDSGNYTNYTWGKTRLNNILLGSVTPTVYANKTAYSIDDYVWYDDDLYICTAEVDESNTAWPEESFTKADLPISVNSAANADNASKVNNHTVETDVPANALFTDTKVTQNSSTTNAEYPLLTKYTNNTTNETNTTKYVSGVTVNPKTKTITAAKFNGSISSLTCTSAEYGGSSATTDLQTALNNLSTAVGNRASSVKVGETSYSPSSGVISLPEYPSIEIEADSTNGDKLTVNNVSVNVSNAAYSYRTYHIATARVDDEVGAIWVE